MAIQHVKYFLKEMGQPIDQSILKSILYDTDKIEELDKKAQTLLSNATCKSLVSPAIPQPETARVELHTITRISSPIIDGMKNDGGDGGVVETGTVVAAVCENESIQPMKVDD